MGNCQCTARPRTLKQNYISASPLNKKRKQVTIIETSIDQDKKENSVININLRRKTSIFQDVSCPIDSQITEQLQKQLGEFQIPFLGVSGEYSIVWKEMRINEKRNWWYMGEWKDGRMHGKGSLYNKQQKFLVSGLFINDKIVTSKCRIIFDSGSFYIGSINQFYEADGHGQMHFKNGSKYIGNFIGGLPNGSGEQINDNYQFNGTFEKGIKKYGTLNDKLGIYEGQFQNNMKHGVGNITTKDGRKYHAQYSMNKPIKKLEAIQMQIESKQTKIECIR